MWRGLNEYEGTPVSKRSPEFPDGADTLQMDDVSRRKFMGLMGASAALAGATLTGCVRKPVQRIVPHAERPEHLIPGEPIYYRTTFNAGRRVIGLEVESQDGRPTKVEGNPEHPMSLGGTDAWAQASVLGLYDSDRSKHPYRNGNTTGWSSFSEFLNARVSAAGDGTGVAILVDSTASPTRKRLLGEIQRRWSGVKIYEHDLLGAPNARAGAAMAGGNGVMASYDLGRAKVVLSIDSDFLGVDGDVARNSRLAMQSRKVDSAKAAAMNRIYSVEPSLTVTGLSADERLPLSGAECGAFLIAVGAELARANAIADQGAAALLRRAGNAGGQTAWRRAAGSTVQRWIAAVADDLAAAQGAVAVMVGERQPAWVHGIAVAINVGLGASVPNGPVKYTRIAASVDGQSISAFVGAAKAGNIKTAFIIDSNPALTAPGDVDIAGALDACEAVIQLSPAFDETAAAAAVGATTGSIG